MSAALGFLGGVGVTLFVQFLMSIREFYDPEEDLVQCLRRIASSGEEWRRAVARNGARRRVGRLMYDPPIELVESPRPDDEDGEHRVLWLECRTALDRVDAELSRAGFPTVCSPTLTTSVIERMERVVPIVDWAREVVRTKFSTDEVPWGLAVEGGDLLGIEPFANLGIEP